MKFSIHMQTLVAVYNDLPEDYPGKPWYVLERWQVAESELAAWAPLPEWTGEVAE